MVESISVAVSYSREWRGAVLRANCKASWNPLLVRQRFLRGASPTNPKYFRQCAELGRDLSFSQGDGVDALAARGRSSRLAVLMCSVETILICSHMYRM